MVNDYIKSIEQTCNSAIPKIKTKKKINLPWMSVELEQMKKEMMTAKRRISNAASRHRPHVVQEYLKKKEKYEEEAHKAVVESWKNFCRAQSRESLWDYIYGVIRKTTNRRED